MSRGRGGLEVVKSGGWGGLALWMCECRRDLVD